MTSLSDAALDHLRQAGGDSEPSSDRYDVIRELGRGGMGVVYLAQDRQLGREVALKVLTGMHTASDDARLVREAQVLAGLEHPGIVPVHDMGELVDGRQFYVMRLVRGETLASRLASGMPVRDGLRVFSRICEAVAFAHAQGVIHRDLTPRNVMLGAFGDVLVLDWGVAKQRNAQPALASSGRMTTSGTTQDGAVLGTPGYMAPEQVGDAANADERADVFALGRILGDIVAADPAGEAAPLRSVIGRATQPVPQNRYDSVSSLARDVTAYLDGLPVSAHRESLAERVVRLGRKHHVALSLISVYLLVRLLMLVFLRR